MAVSAEQPSVRPATIGLRDLVSPGSLAVRLWRRSGATPPLAKFSTPDDAALGDYAAGSHGGWCTAELRGQVLPAVDVDVRQAYPAAACLAGIHRVLFAEQLCEVDQLDDARELNAAAAVGDLRPFFERATYEHHAFTRCSVLLQGEHCPIELAEPRGPRLVVRPVTSHEPMSMCLNDVMAASLLSGRPVRILSATGLEPSGAEDVLPISLYGDVVVGAGEDPVAALVRLRPPRGSDDPMRASIRGVANAAWGVFARLDQHIEQGRLVECYAAWSWPVIAASIPAIVRMWLAMVDRAVTEAGGAVICRDTDGLAIVSSPEGGKVQLSGGRVIRALSWSEVADLLRPFDALDPFDDAGAFWSVDRGTEDRPLHQLALGRKRYTKLLPDGAGSFEVTGGTEHSLGGGVVDPPGWTARGPDDLRRWVRTVHEYALSCAIGPDPGWRAPWDEGADQPFPVLRRFSAASPSALAEVPAALGLHPFGSWVEAEPDKLFGDPGVPVALDPGDDLASWAKLAWFHRDGRRVRVGTTERLGVDVVARTLDDYAYGWTRPVLEDDDEDVIEIDPRLVRKVGRGGALIDAQLADPSARAKDHQVCYSAGDAAAFVADEARRTGKRAFARLTGLPATVAGRAALGLPISAANVERALQVLTGRRTERLCALDGCEQPVLRPNAHYCSKAHADRAYRQRRRARPAPVAPDPFAAVPTCGSCDAYMRGAADAGTGLCVDCAEARP